MIWFKKHSVSFQQPSARPVVMVVAAGLLTASCQTTSGTSDPCAYRSGSQNIFGATASVVTDQYAECTRKLQAQLEELQLANIKAKRRADSLEALAAKSKGEAAAAATRLAEVNRKSQTALNALNEIKAKKDADQAQLDKLLQQQAALEDQKRALSEKALGGGGDPGKFRAEIAALEQEQSALLQIIEAQLKT